MVRVSSLLTASLLAITAASSDLIKTACSHSTNSCTASRQRAQASAFCSSFVGPTPTTRFTYPNVQTTSLKCCKHCAYPTLQSLPSELQPPTAAPTITAAPTAPSCFGNATAASQILNQCSCLGVAQPTTTATYAAPLTLQGPFYFDTEIGIRVEAGPPLYNVTYEGNELMTNYPEQSQSNATIFHLDQFGRLFNTNPPTVPFSLPARSSPRNKNGSYVEKVLYAAAYDPYVPVLCRPAHNKYFPMCTLDCKPFDDPDELPDRGFYRSYTCPNNATSCEEGEASCQMWWWLAARPPPLCFSFLLLVRPGSASSDG